MSQAAIPAPRTPSSSMNAAAENLLLGVLERLERLCVVYTQELDSLSVNDMHKFQNLQHEKMRLIRDCENGVAEIRTRQDEVALCSPALKERVLSAHGVLNELAIQSQHACDIRAKSMQRIQDRLLYAARAMVEKSGKRYGHKGKLHDYAGNRPMATAINEAI